jgi:hypothetical protein
MEWSRVSWKSRIRLSWQAASVTPGVFDARSPHWMRFGLSVSWSATMAAESSSGAPDRGGSVELPSPIEVGPGVRAQPLRPEFGHEIPPRTQPPRGRFGSACRLQDGGLEDHMLLDRHAVGEAKAIHAKPCTPRSS